MADQKRDEFMKEAALRRWLNKVGDERTPLERNAYRIGYDAALADNAERVREAEAAKRLSDEWMTRTYEEKAYRKRERDRADAAESTIAEARSIADRPLGTHIDYEPMDMIRDLQKALGTRVHDREPCRCGNVKDLAEARATIERLKREKPEARRTYDREELFCRSCDSVQVFDRIGHCETCGAQRSSR